VCGNRHLGLALTADLELGAAIGGLTAVATEQPVDGYTPFENSFSASHVRLGIIWLGAATKDRR
jgi:hypothetical protein